MCRLDEYRLRAVIARAAAVVVALAAVSLAGFAKAFGFGSFGWCLCQCSDLCCSPNPVGSNRNHCPCHPGRPLDHNQPRGLPLLIIQRIVSLFNLLCCLNYPAQNSRETTFIANGVMPERLSR